MATIVIVTSRQTLCRNFLCNGTLWVVGVLTNGRYLFFLLQKKIANLGCKNLEAMKKSYVKENIPVICKEFEEVKEPPVNLRYTMRKN